VNAYNEALSVDPDYIPALLNKGSALHKLGRYQEAVNAYDDVLSRDPNRVTAWYNKGLALGELGRISKR
jgi:tetratricopeptide (TPR) repeat protein